MDEVLILQLKMRGVEKQKYLKILLIISIKENFHIMELGTGYYFEKKIKIQK